MTLSLPEGKGAAVVVRKYVHNDSPAAKLVQAAAEDAFQRLLFPAVEREIRKNLTETADAAAIQLFAANLRQLLLAAPLKNQVVLGVDPGYRTGCKLAVVDETGAVLDTGVAHITVGEGTRMEQGKKSFWNCCKRITLQRLPSETALPLGKQNRLWLPC